MQNDITRRGLLGGALAMAGGLVMPRMVGAMVVTPPTPTFHPDPSQLFKKLPLLHHVTHVPLGPAPSKPARQFYLNRLNLPGNNLFVTHKSPNIPMLVVEPKHIVRLLLRGAMYSNWVGTGTEDEIISKLREHCDAHLVRAGDFIVAVDKQNDTFPALLRYTCPPFIRVWDTRYDAKGEKRTRLNGPEFLSGYVVWNHLALSCGTVIK